MNFHPSIRSFDGLGSCTILLILFTWVPFYLAFVHESTEPELQVKSNVLADAHTKFMQALLKFATASNRLSHEDKVGAIGNVLVSYSTLMQN